MALQIGCCMPEAEHSAQQGALFVSLANMCSEGEHNNLIVGATLQRGKSNNCNFLKAAI